MKFSKDILFKLIILISILLLFQACAKEKKRKTSDNKTQKKISSQILIKKFTFQDTSNGKINWTLNSEEAIIDNNKKIINLKKVNIKYKDKYIITAEKGRYYMKKKIAELYNNVKMANDDTYFLTENLTFNSKQNKIETNNKIEILNPKFNLTANSLEGFLEKKRFILKGKVKSVIR